MYVFIHIYVYQNLSLKLTSPYNNMERQIQCQATITNNKLLLALSHLLHHIACCTLLFATDLSLSRVLLRPSVISLAYKYKSS